MLRVLIAPTAYKRTLSPGQVAAAIAEGVKNSGSTMTVVLLPLADGGDGTVEALHLTLGGQVHALEVSGPLEQRVMARWLKLPALAVVELASACGMALLPPAKLAPLEAHTAGLGEVVRHCLRRGEASVVVTVGGSASTDGGSGALRAMGARFLDAGGRELPPGGGSLLELHRCDLTGLTWLDSGVRIRVATDVNNPLLGPTGAAAIYAPQKGATQLQVVMLERGLKRLADCLEEATGRHLREAAGSGAAGGTAFGLACALGAEIIPGFKWVAELTHLEEMVASCDLVVSGEGKLDEQSFQGKVIGELAAICSKLGRRLWLIPATADPAIIEHELGIERIMPAAEPGQVATAADVARSARALFRQTVVP